MPRRRGSHAHAAGHRVDPACVELRSARFERMSAWTVRAAGCRWGFRAALLLILAWAGSGPYFRYHESWATSFTVVTTSVTFLMVFLIQNAQNRELKAVHLKLDELIFAGKNARNELIHIEHLTEEQLDLLGHRYGRLAEMHRKARKPTAGTTAAGHEDEAEGDRAGDPPAP